MAAKEKILMISGKRKTSIAKARVISGSGKVIVNKVSHNNLTMMHKLSIEEPLRIAKKTLKNIDFDILIKVKGGGRESQIEAARLALAKALVEKTKSLPLRKAFMEYDKHLLVADVRRKEANKPGDSKARANRQTSYR